MTIEPVKKCIIHGCDNHTDHGVFVGYLCSPCYQYLKTGEGIFSQAYRNEKQIENLKILCMGW
jgi:hypothetical protein